jgi:Holliday junction resolvase RusA-like endonuclease
MIFEIPVVPLSPNVSLRRYWGARRKDLARYEAEMLYAVGNVRFASRLNKKAIMKIHQVRKRRLDPDNLVGSCKLLIDACRYLELIRDDSEKWLSLQVSQETGRPVRTLIEIQYDGEP